MQPPSMEPLGARLPTSPIGQWRRWRQRRAIRRLRNDGSLAAVRNLARALVWAPPEDGVVLNSLLGALAAMGEPAQLRVMAEEATAGGSHHAPTPLLSLLKSPDRFPLLPPDQQVAVAMACGEPELLAMAGAEVVPPLLEAWERQGPKDHAETALLALRSSAAVDELCRHWIDQGAREDSFLLQLLLKAGHAPSDPAERALHRWLMGPVDPSGEEDRNGSLLVRALATASPPLRQRVVAAVLAQGQAEWLLQAMQRRKPLPSFDADDWADVVRLLAQTDDGDVLWRWALQAPPELTRPLLQAIPANALLPPDPLGRLHRPHLLQVVGEVATRDWPERVSPPLIAILKSAGFVPLAPPDQRVAVALACGWPARLAADGPAILTPLLKAWCAEASKGLAAAALAQLSAAATIDALCRHWMAYGEADDSLAALLREAGHAPSDPAERALFWLLSGQLELYDHLDRDGSLLAAARATTSAPARQRLAAASAAAGRTAWLQVVQQSQPLEAFSADDWATAVPVVARTGDAETLWRWALRCPPLHSRTLLRALPAGAAPPPQLGEAGRVLQALAQELPPAPDPALFLPDQCSHTLQWRSASDSMWMAWSHDGRCLATASGDRAIWIWDPAKGACSHTLDGHNGSVHAIAWSPKWFGLAHVSTGDTIRLWEPTCGANTLPGLALPHGPERVLSWSPDGRWLASGGSTRPIRLWDPANGACVHTDHPGEARSMAWSPDGRHLAFASTGNTIRLWEAAQKRCAQILQGQTGQGRSIAWAPDGRWLAASGGDGTLRLWDLAGGQAPRLLRGHLLRGHAEGLMPIAWSPDGRWLASSSQGTIQLWDPSSGTCAQTLNGPIDRIPSMAWSPDGRCLATASGDRAIWIWDPARGACSHTLEGHKGSVHAIAWSPDGRQLASAGADRTVRLWSHHCPVRMDMLALVTTPLHHYKQRHWSSLETVYHHTLPTAEWQWILPWLRFIAGLGGVIRRFDVDLEETTPPQQESPYAVILDG